MESRSGAVPGMKPSELSNKQVTRLHQLFHEAKFRDPDGEHLSPAGRPSLYRHKSGLAQAALA